MSIFKHIEEDGDSVVEHFYDEEKEDIINNRMRIWRTTMGHYIDLVSFFCVSNTFPSKIGQPLKILIHLMTLLIIRKTPYSNFTGITLLVHL